MYRTELIYKYKIKLMKNVPFKMKTSFCINPPLLYNYIYYIFAIIKLKTNIIKI